MSRIFLGIFLFVFGSLSAEACHLRSVQKTVTKTTVRTSLPTFRPVGRPILVGPDAKFVPAVPKIMPRAIDPCLLPAAVRILR